MVAKKREINPECGWLFRTLRESHKYSRMQFRDVISPQKIERFELGQAELSFDELATCLSKMNENIDYFMKNVYQREIPSNYGEIFQDLREQCELSRSDLTAGSAKELEAFENGQIMLDSDDLLDNLDQMNITVEDYLRYVNFGRAQKITNFIHHVDQAILQNNQAKLSKIYEKTTNKMLKIAVKSRLSNLTETEIEEISGFLMAVDYWTTSELFILEKVANQLNTELLEIIWNDLYREHQRFSDSAEHCQRMILIANHSIFHLLSEGKINAAQKILRESAFFLQEENLFSQCLYKFTDSFYYFKRRNHSKYLREMRSIISFMLRIDNESMSNYFLTLYNHYVLGKS